MTCAALIFRSPSGLSAMKSEPGVGGAGRPGERDDVLDRRVALDDGGDLAHRRVHRLERRVLRPEHAPASAPVSCGGKKPFGMFTMSTTLSAIVSASTASVSAGLASTQCRVRR